MGGKTEGAGGIGGIGGIGGGIFSIIFPFLILMLLFGGIN